MDFSLSGTDPSNPSWVKMCRLGENWDPYEFNM
jgi:hypothetical protein